jgi:hypothetical protein
MGDNSKFSEIEEPELRMYFFTNYQLTGIQKGIQCGHAALEYADKYAGDEVFIRFVREHKTWVILNGGTTNERRDFDGMAFGSLNQIGDSLLENDIQFSYFQEPDLNDALTALCFIADERVFNKKDYPDFIDYIFDVKMYADARGNVPEQNYLTLKRLNSEKQQELFPEYYKEWVIFVGGVKNVFLRELIKDKKLA